MVVTEYNCFLMAERNYLIDLPMNLADENYDKIHFYKTFSANRFCKNHDLTYHGRKSFDNISMIFQGSEIISSWLKNFTDERHTNRNGFVTWHSWNITHDNSLECTRSSFFVIDTWLKSFLKSFIFDSSEIFMKQRDRTKTNVVSKINLTVNLS